MPRAMRVKRARTLPRACDVALASKVRVPNVPSARQKSLYKLTEQLRCRER